MVDNTKLISIVIPAYNIEQYLPRCLDSILVQTYDNLEIIIVSDGSCDNTNDIIRQYAQKDQRIKYILKDNSGVSDTRNKGLDIAEGDYIGFVDGDDYIEPNMFELLYNNMIQYDAEISHCGYQMVYPSKTVYYHGTNELYEYDTYEGITALIKADTIEPSIWNKLYKREVIGSIRFDTRLSENEDFLFNIQVFKNCKKSIFVDKPLYHYILRENSACTSSFNIKKTDNQILVMELLSELLQDQKYKNFIESRYINVLIGAYRTSCMHNQVEERYRLKIIDNRILLKHLSFVKKIEVELIVIIPCIYRIITRLYKRYLYKNPYEVK